MDESSAKGIYLLRKQICDAMDYFLLPVDEDRIDMFKAVKLGTDKDADTDTESKKNTTKKRKKRNVKEKN